MKNMRLESGGKNKRYCVALDGEIVEIGWWKEVK